MLGHDLDSVTFETLSGLIGVPEDDVLEVKSETYGGGDSERRELCADVAAFANGSGGLLVIGAEEDSDTVQALTPLELDGEELRVRSIIASGVMPPVDLTVRPIPSGDPAVGCLLVLVPGSSAAPHAVLKDTDLRYPVRDGAGKRWMREPEVADRYRSRFVRAAGRLERASSIEAKLAKRIRDEVSAWLTISIAPIMEGRTDVSFAGRDEMITWLRHVVGGGPPFYGYQDLAQTVSTGFRSYLAGSVDQGSQYALAELHSDGAGAAATWIGEPDHQQWAAQDSDEGLPRFIADAGLAIAIVGTLHLLGNFAARCGATGMTNVLASIHSGGETILGNRRFHGLAEKMGSRSLVEIESATHSFDLDDLTDPTRLVGAASLVSSDLMSAFGHPGCLQLSPEGSVRTRYVDAGYQRFLTWAANAGVELSDEAV